MKFFNVMLKIVGRAVACLQQIISLKKYYNGLLSEAGL